MYLHRDNLLPKELFFQPHFTIANSRHVWILIKGYVNQLCGKTPTDLRIGVLPPEEEERHGLAAVVLRIARRRKSPVRGVFGEIFPYPPSFEERRLDPCVLPTPPLVGTRLSTSCLMHCA
jgi:hypothetical protein